MNAARARELEKHGVLVALLLAADLDVLSAAPKRGPFDDDDDDDVRPVGEPDDDDDDDESDDEDDDDDEEPMQLRIGTNARRGAVTRSR